MEVGLALLAHASMPLKFWDEAFLAACYLINCLPSKVIQFDTPLERLFKQVPDYKSLPTFGCACWPNLRPYNSHKLQFRSKQCVFLGFSNLHKGFKCLDVSTGRVYVSRDVTFDEQVFPFANLHPNAGARLRAEISLLPSNLTNSTFDQGGEEQHDQKMFNIHVSNATDEVCVDAAIDTGCDDGITGENGNENAGENTDAGALDRVHIASENRAGESLLDPAPDATSSQGEQAVSSGSASQGEQVSSPQRSPARSSAGNQSSAAASTPVVSTRMHAINVPTGSSSPAAHAQPSVSSEVMRPKTRLQSGIRKEKIYTDGTVRYSCFTSSGEPQTLDEALGNKN